MGMNLIIKAGEKETRGPKMDSGIRQPTLRGYMDDFTITMSSHIQARWVLAKLEEMATWARMTFKPKKSRNLIIRKGNITFKYNLAIQGETIPSIKDNPIEYLVKWYDESLKDHNNVRTTEKQAELWLKKIETSGLPGKFKTWPASQTDVAADCE